MSRNVALILSGCGNKDGSEITESASMLIALSQENYVVHMYAPDRPCFDEVNYLTDEIQQHSKRNILVESARIARSKIKPLESLEPSSYDALLFPGGLGAAKNLCNFALKGDDAVIHEDVKSILFSFIKMKKVVGAVCIAPILLALAARELKLASTQLTFGTADNDVARMVSAWGIQVFEKKAHEICLDRENRFVSSPAYMYDSATPSEIFQGAVAFVKGLNELIP
jgi:enhancing lycopene biosynthesis protein 2